MWAYDGHQRPDFASAPGPGQESVWDYPRPPKLAPDRRLVKVYDFKRIVAHSNGTYRVLETASPPSFYIPPEDVNWDLLMAGPGSSVCEWKGIAKYWTLWSNPRSGIIGWGYPEPRSAFEKIRDYISFYPASLACYVAGERVRAQAVCFFLTMAIKSWYLQRPRQRGFFYFRPRDGPNGEIEDDRR